MRVRDVCAPRKDTVSDKGACDTECVYTSASFLGVLLAKALASLAIRSVDLHGIGRHQSSNLEGCSTRRTPLRFAAHVTILRENICTFSLTLMGQASMSRQITTVEHNRRRWLASAAEEVVLRLSLLPHEPLIRRSLVWPWSVLVTILEHSKGSCRNLAYGCSPSSSIPHVLCRVAYKCHVGRVRTRKIPQCKNDQTRILARNLCFVVIKILLSL